MAPRELLDARLGRGEADEHVRVQTEPIRVASLDVPARGYVDGHDGQVGACDERERCVERGAHGGLEREAEDRV